MPHIIYLHGFASSPASNKARWFAARFFEHGVPLHVPDLNAPDFEHLTLTALLARVAETIAALPPDDVYLMGSSLGGAAAVHFADRYRDAYVRKLLLMAPSFDFAANRLKQLGAGGMADWRESGWLEMYHYGDRIMRRVHYGLMEDLLRYDSFAVQVDVPILIYHGQNDASVDHRQSVRFAAERPNVDLRLLDSDHELLDQTETMWQGAADFFGV